MRADEIRQARKRQRLTQAELAAKVGVSRVTVGEWEAGRQVPTPANLAEIARALRDAASAGATATPDTPDAEHQALPGYWIGYLDATRHLLDEAHGMLGRANGRIGRMVAAGSTWEAATVRARLVGDKAARDALEAVDIVDRAAAARAAAESPPPANAAAPTRRRAGGSR